MVQLDLHQYADLSVLKEKFDPTSYDKVRIALGLEPLQEAVEAGKQITENVRQKMGN